MVFFPIPWYLIIAMIFIVILTTSLGAMTGFSGSVFIVPIFSLILLSYNIPFITIVGCSASGCFFNGLISTVLNIRRREIDWILALVFETPTMGGVFLGAFLTTKLDNQVITTFFASFVLVLAIILFIQNRKSDDIPDIDEESEEENKAINGEEIEEEVKRKKKEKKKKRKKKGWRRPFIRKIAEFGPQWKVERESYTYTINILMLLGSAFLIGFLAGMVGCGGGWIKAPVLVSGFGVPSIIAISSSMLMTTITLLISGTMHIILGHFALWLWVIIAIGSIVGSFIGTGLKKRFSSKVLQLIMTFTLIAIAIILILQTWIGV